MPKTETVFARITLKSYNDTFTLNENHGEINERVFEVFSDDFYLKKLTETVSKYHPDELAPWTTYRKEMLAINRPVSDLQAIAKFHVMDQRVDLVDIAFY